MITLKVILFKQIPCLSDSYFCKYLTLKAVLKLTLKQRLQIRQGKGKKTGRKVDLNLA